jgi:hypothetical protein
MAKTGKRGRDEADTYEADDFVEDDDGSAPKSKKSKKAAPSGGSKSGNKFFEASHLNWWTENNSLTRSSSLLAEILDELRSLILRAQNSLVFASTTRRMMSGCQAKRYFASRKSLKIILTVMGAGNFSYHWPI